MSTRNMNKILQPLKKILWRISALIPVFFPDTIRLSKHTLEGTTNHVKSILFTDKLRQEIGPSTHDEAVADGTFWPKRFCHLIKDATLHSDTGLVYLDGKLINQSGSFFESSFHTAIMYRLTGPPRRKSKTHVNVASLAIPPAHSYWHWVCEILPLVLRMDEIVPNLEILVGRDQPTYVGETLRILERSFTVCNKKWVNVANLWVIDKPTFGWYHPTEIELVRKRASALNSLGLRSEIKKVYVSREGWLRTMSNENVLESWLQAEGFYILRTKDGLSIADQVKLFSNVDTIVSASGSGLANAIFMNPKSHVIEIFSDSFDIPEVVSLCGSLGMKHSRVKVHSTQDYPFGDGTQIISQLDSILKP